MYAAIKNKRTFCIYRLFNYLKENVSTKHLARRCYIANFLCHGTKEFRLLSASCSLTMIVLFLFSPWWYPVGIWTYRGCFTHVQKVRSYQASNTKRPKSNVQKVSLLDICGTSLFFFCRVRTFSLDVLRGFNLGFYWTTAMDVPLTPELEVLCTSILDNLWFQGPHRS